jgi:hypothetical protein
LSKQGEGHGDNSVLIIFFIISFGGYLPKAGSFVGLGVSYRDFLDEFSAVAAGIINFQLVW